MDYEKSIKSKISTRRHFAGFERQYASDIKRMNQAAGQIFLLGTMELIIKIIEMQ